MSDIKKLDLNKLRSGSEESEDRDDDEYADDDEDDGIIQESEEEEEGSAEENSSIKNGRSSSNSRPESDSEDGVQFKVEEMGEFERRKKFSADMKEKEETHLWLG